MDVHKFLSLDPHLCSVFTDASFKGDPRVFLMRGFAVHLSAWHGLGNGTGPQQRCVAQLAERTEGWMGGRMADAHVGGILVEFVSLIIFTFLHGICNPFQISH